MTKESRLSFVIANSELEGMHCPPDEIKHYEDIIEGRATAAEKIAEFIRLHEIKYGKTIV